MPYNTPTAECSMRVRRGHRMRRESKRDEITAVTCLPVLSTSGMAELIPYMWNQTQAASQAAAFGHRLACEMPDIDSTRASDLEKFARRITATIPKLSTELLTSLWMDTRKYTKKVKIDFMEHRLDHFSAATYRDLVANTSFIKREMMCKAKHARGINSYSDASKAILGPWIKSVERTVFAHFPVFSKGTDPKDLPELLRTRLGDGPVMETDFTSMEGHHREVLMRVSRDMMLHVLDGAPPVIKRIINRMCMGVNKCSFGCFTGEVAERLMSGALWTSLANGYLNFILLTYLRARSERPDDSVESLADNWSKYFDGLVEGDDGITKATELDERIISELGLRLKFERHNHFGDASYCGTRCSRDSDQIQCDPMKVLRNLVWVDPALKDAKRSKVLAQVRAKAMSYAHTYTGCPIVYPFAQRILELTAGINITDVAKFCRGSYEQKRLQRALDAKPWRTNSEITPGAREYMHARSGISPTEQERIEKELSAGTLEHGFRVDLGAYVAQADAEHVERHYTPAGPVLPLHSHPTPYRSDWLEAVLRDGTYGKAVRGPDMEFDKLLGECIPVDALDIHQWLVNNPL